MSTVVTERAPSSGLRTRLMAFTVLGAVVSAAGFLGQQGYRAATDSFVAPAILSPDNDLVMAAKVKISELYVERARVVGEVEGIDADLLAAENAVTRLESLLATAARGVAWTKSTTGQQVASASRDLGTLAQQKEMLDQMVEKQRALVSEARANWKDGLVSKTDLARETQSFDQMQLASLENERSQMLTRAQLTLARSAQMSLAANSAAPQMPEMIGREEQMVRLELEVLRLRSECRAKRAEKKILQDKLAKMDELEGQLRARPIFRAAEKSVDVAFVPYTQSAGVTAGAEVFECTWGLFRCKSVGRVAELVRGEVILPDPWGNQARGYYAILELTDHQAAQSKVLRVRGLPPPATTPSAETQTVSVR